MRKFLRKLLSIQSHGQARVPGTLEGIFSYQPGRIEGEIIDLHNIHASEITVTVARGDKEILSHVCERVGKSERYRFIFPTNNSFNPAELISEKVSVTARSALGHSGKLRIDGASGLELIREYFGVPAETICHIDFTKYGNSGEYTKQGWLQPGPEHSHTCDYDSFVRLPTITKQGKYALRFVSGALLKPPFLPTQLVQMYLNGDLIWTEEFKMGPSQFFEIGLLADPYLGKPLELRVHHPDAARPCDLSETNTDTTLIALSVKRLTLIRFL
jgi:hypothetical protein